MELFHISRFSSHTWWRVRKHYAFPKFHKHLKLHEFWTPGRVEVLWSHFANRTAAMVEYRGAYALDDLLKADQSNFAEFRRVHHWTGPSADQGWTATSIFQRVDIGSTCSMRRADLRVR